MIIFRINNLRKKKNISMRRLSKLSNVSKSYIQDIEKGRKYNPSLEKLCAIANALDVNVKDLFYTKLDIDLLRIEMHNKIDKYGLNSSEVMEISQLIDLLINIDLHNKKDYC